MGSLGSSEPPACSAGFVRFLAMTLGQGGQCRYLRPCKEVSILLALPLLATHMLKHLQLDAVSIPSFCLQIYAYLTTVYTVLDDDTCQQLNRIEAMLTVICNSSGIVPETLLGYDHPTSASLSSQSQSSAGIQMETLHISDTCSNTSSHSSTRSLQPPHKKAGMYSNRFTDSI
jgi:hypothetical protein